MKMVSFFANIKHMEDKNMKEQEYRITYSLQNNERMRIDGRKSIFAAMVLRLMDTEEYSNNYCKALALVLELFPQIDREELEKELDNYI